MINSVTSLYYKFENNEDNNTLDEDDLNILRDTHAELQSLRFFP